MVGKLVPSKMPPIELIQKRIANISVGPSTVRRQPEGTAAIARKYLWQPIVIKHFSKVKNEKDFKNRLNTHTSKLKDKLPSKSWGIARKVLNLFLFQAVQDINLNKKYALDKLINYLELPLDNTNGKNLKEFAKKIDGGNLEWKNISSLTPEINEQFQEYAKRCANWTYKCARCYLDVYWWRSENTSPNH